MKKIIIYGSSGFIGHNILQFLSGKGEFLVTGYSSKICDLLDKNQIQHSLFGCDRNTTVVFCSAIGRNIDDSYESMIKNIEMMNNFISTINPESIGQIIFISSVDVYGLPAVSYPISESTVLNPQSFYGLSKYICEKILTFRFPAEFPVMVLRLPGVYGEHDKGLSIVGKLYNKISDEENITVTGNGSQKRDFVYVTDICRIIYHFICSPSKITLNVVTGKEISISELIQHLSFILGKDPQITYLEKDPYRDFDLFFDNHLLLETIPGFCFTPIENGIIEYKDARRKD
jgi:UDP-glucose 4-epimerase